MKRIAIMTSILVFASLSYAHHRAPADMQDFIEDQLEEVGSPHLLSSEDDPSLLDVAPTTMDDVDYVVVATELDDTAVTSAADEILQMLDNANQVCDDSFTIDLESDGTYTLTVYVDYCDE